jgi:ankyrin repeat protein
MEEDSELYDLLDELNHLIEYFDQEPEQRHWETITRLLTEHRELARMTDDLGHYPLHNAAYYDRTFAIARLLEAGAEVDALTEEDEQTPLHLAAHNGNSDACVRLAEAGANLTRRAANGLTPLLVAIYRRQYAVIGQLLALGAPMDLRAAINLRQRTVVRLVLRDNPGLIHEEPDATDLVAEAAGAGDVEVVRLLLEAGADPNTANVAQNSLLNAVSNNDRATTELLLRYGAQPDRVAGSARMTARQYAEMYTEKLKLGWALELFDNPPPRIR